MKRMIKNMYMYFFWKYKTFVHLYFWPRNISLFVLDNPLDQLTTEELKDICTAFKPFKKVIVELSAEKVFTSSKIKPMIKNVFGKNHNGIKFYKKFENIPVRENQK